uniref:Sorting and assembly machinery component 50 homolog (inferred by orthology to a human protein) n=1 Tax=Strongyloides venezuelensis TaxID=75913 RepID=A0A0K0FID2_STRVS
MATELDSAELIFGKADKAEVFLDNIQFLGVNKTKEDALIKESSELFKSTNLDELVKNAGICAKHLQEVGLLGDCIPYIDVSPNYKHGYIVRFVSKDVKNFEMQCKTQMSSSGSEVEGLGSFAAPSYNGRGNSMGASVSGTLKREYSFDFHYNKPLLGWKRYENVGIAIGTPVTYRDWNCARLSEIFTSIYYSNRRFLKREIDLGLRTNISLRKLLSNSNAPFPIRDQSGYTMKSSIEGSLTIDRRDRPLLAKQGTFSRCSLELAGLLGDAAFVKGQVDLQASAPFPFGTILSASLRGIHVQPSSNKKLHLLDSAYLGGPHDVRGFQFNSIGTRADKACLGGGTAIANVYHIYRPILTKDSLYLHGFTTFASVARVNSKAKLHELIDGLRVSAGFGLTYVWDNMIRFELNFVRPLRYTPGDAVNDNKIQFSVGMDFL